MKKKKQIFCKGCGKKIEKGSYCNHECYINTIKKHGVEKTSKLTSLSNENKCVQCGKVMDINRISAYCEECEMLIVETYDVLTY